MRARDIFKRTEPVAVLATEDREEREMRKLAESMRLRAEAKARQRAADEKRGKFDSAGDLRQRIEAAERERKETVARLQAEHEAAMQAFHDCEYNRLKRQVDETYLSWQQEQLRLEQKVGRLRVYLAQAENPRPLLEPEDDSHAFRGTFVGDDE